MVSVSERPSAPDASGPAHTPRAVAARRRLPDLFEAGADPEIWQWQGGPAPAAEAELGAKLDALLGAAERGAYGAVRGRRSRHRQGGALDGVHRHRRGERASGDRLDLVRPGLLAHAGQHRGQAATARARVRDARHGPGPVEDRRPQPPLPGRDRAAGRPPGGRAARPSSADDGTWRDTVYFSLLAAEWPQCKERLRHGSSPVRPGEVGDSAGQPGGRLRAEFGLAPRPRPRGCGARSCPSPTAVRRARCPVTRDADARAAAEGDHVLAAGLQAQAKEVVCEQSARNFSAAR